MAAPRVRALVFDLDGTLIDSLGDIVAAANHTLACHGYPARSAEDIRGFVGDGARSLVARIARRPASDPALDAMLETFLAYYTAHAVTHTRLLPCAREVLDHFQPLALALCTNKPRATTDAVLSGLGLEQYFAVSVAAGDLATNKPDPLPLQHIARELGVATGELVMVGDGPQDIECARAAGARSVGVENGIADRERLRAAAPDALLADLCGLPDLIARWQRD